MPGHRKRHHVKTWEDKVFTCTKPRNRGTSCDVDVNKVTCPGCLARLDVTQRTQNLPAGSVEALKAALLANGGHLDVRAAVSPQGGFIEVRCYPKGSPRPFLELKLSDLKVKAWSQVMAAVSRAVDSRS